MIEVLVSSLRFDSSSDTCVVVLQEKDGERILPIWIGRPEAESIVVHVQNVKHARPLTHDLVRSLIQGLGAELRRVYISRVEDRTYFAELQLRVNAAPVNVDARPSDGIAIAVRLNAPIFAAEDLLMLPAAEVSDDVSPESALAAEDYTVEPPGASTPEELTTEQLKRYLEALRPEDFGKFNP